MADVNRGNRPLSPHMTIYRPQINSVMSILHRITGVGMLLGAALIVWWFLAASTSPEYFEVVDGLLNSWIGGLVMIFSCFALWYHFCNGIRHLVWDIGFGFEIPEIIQSGYVVLVGAVVLTIVTLIFA